MEATTDFMGDTLLHTRVHQSSAHQASIPVCKLLSLVPTTKVSVTTVGILYW
jgi:hypothetical protein